MRFAKTYIFVRPLQRYTLNRWYERPRIFDGAFRGYSDGIHQKIDLKIIKLNVYI